MLTIKDFFFFFLVVAAFLFNAFVRNQNSLGCDQNWKFVQRFMQLPLLKTNQKQQNKKIQNKKKIESYLLFHFKKKKEKKVIVENLLHLGYCFCCVPTLKFMRYAKHFMQHSFIWKYTNTHRTLCMPKIVLWFYMWQQQKKKKLKKITISSLFFFPPK